jgi:hypothetical protein
MKVTEKVFIELRKLFPQIPDKNVTGLILSLQCDEPPTLIINQSILEVQDAKDAKDAKDVLQFTEVYFIDSTKVKE